MKRQIGVRREAMRQPRLHPVVDRIDRPPGEIGRDRDRPEYDKAGEEPRSQPGGKRSVERSWRFDGHQALARGETQNGRSPSRKQGEDVHEGAASKVAPLTLR